MNAPTTGAATPTKPKELGTVALFVTTAPALVFVGAMAFGSAHADQKLAAFGLTALTAGALGATPSLIGPTLSEWMLHRVAKTWEQKRPSVTAAKAIYIGTAAVLAALGLIGFLLAFTGGLNPSSVDDSGALAVLGGCALLSVSLLGAYTLWGLRGLWYALEEARTYDQPRPFTARDRTLLVSGLAIILGTLLQFSDVYAQDDQRCKYSTKQSGQGKPKTIQLSDCKPHEP